MCNNLSIAERLSIKPEELTVLADDNPIWEIISYYLAQLCLNITLMISPEVIILGGGIMTR